MPPTFLVRLHHLILTNYVAHAASIISMPGQSTGESVFAIVMALLLPGSGALRVTRLMWAHAATHNKDGLRRAAAAGALCMVVRKASILSLVPEDSGLNDVNVDSRPR